MAFHWLCGVARRSAATAVNIVIQHVENRKFLAGESEWVLEPQDALTFSNTRQALRYCAHHALRHVRLLVFLGGRKLSLLLYVPGARTPAPAGEMHSTG